MNRKCAQCGLEFEVSPDSAADVPVCPTCMMSMDTDPGLPDVSSAPPPASVPSDTHIPGFIIEQAIGAGAMGQVYQARQVSLDRVVALKVLPRALALRPSFVNRFHEESAALASLNHPNIVSIIDRGHVGHLYYFAMELVDGPTLTDPSVRNMDCAQLLHLGMGVASALMHAHASGVVHRDIKPGNIMINRHGAIKVTDFGLARLMAIGAERDAQIGEPLAKAVLGTPAYMGPEQMHDAENVDGRTDIFALGVVLYELATKRRPVGTLPTPPSEICPTADPRMDPIVARCLQVRPEDRYQTANDLLADLESLSWELQAAPRCPKCSKTTPVRAEQCPECDQDLSTFFDICPDCGRNNRIELRRCLYCNQDLVSRRTTVSRKITLMLDYADDLRLRERFDEALQTLREVRHIEGNAFEEQRKRAERLRRATLAARRHSARERFTKAHDLAQRGAFGQSIDLLKTISPDVRDTTREIEAIRMRQRNVLAQRRATAVTNLTMLIVGIIVVIVTLILVLK